MLCNPVYHVLPPEVSTIIIGARLDSHYGKKRKNNNFKISSYLFLYIKLL
jgi:hypothetical protein